MSTSPIRASATPLHGPLLCWLVVVLPVAAPAQPPRLAAEFQVNGYTSNAQLYPHVSTAADGRFVVVWVSNGSDFFDDHLTSIRARRYSPEGVSPPDIEVNTYTSSFQNHPRVAVAPGGDFTVVWDSYGSDEIVDNDTSPYSIQARRYSSSGSPMGADFQVNSYTTGDQRRPVIGVDGTGAFVIVWSSEGSSGTDQDASSIQGRRYDSSGSPLASQFQVNTDVLGAQSYADVAVAPSGEFVVTWQSELSAGTDDSGLSVQAQRFAGDGSFLGAQFQVNTYTDGDQSRSRVAVGGAGELVVVWQSSGSAGSDPFDESVQARRFEADGSPLGDDFQVNTYTTYVQTEPDVAIGPDGLYVVTWFSDDADSPDTFRSIQARLFAASGSPLADQFQVNTYATSEQRNPAVDFAASGQLVVVWDSFGSSGTDTDDRSVLGQRFSGTGIFHDGFESGTADGWSSVAPP